ncbi:MAG: T9SS type A sorting domain-containing protein [Ignavibacteria bacterium]
MIYTNKFPIYLITLTLSLVLISGYVFSQTINTPGDLEAEPEDSSYIKVKWDDNSNNEEGFYVERSLTSDTSVAWETIGSTGQNNRIFADYWVTNGVEYFYRVYAYAGNIRSAYSNIASTIAEIDTSIIPRAPSDLLINEITETTVTISWQDNSYNESGFIIARREINELLFRYIDTVQTDVLTYQEVGLTPDNVYLYKVCSYNSFGLSDFTNTVSARTNKSTNIINTFSEIPEGFYISDNYPNPFNPETKIKFAIAENSEVFMEIYNISGKKLETLVNGELPAGTYEVIWNASEFASGVYFFRTRVIYNGGRSVFSKFNKMILNK